MTDAFDVYAAATVGCWAVYCFNSECQIKTIDRILILGAIILAFPPLLPQVRMQAFESLGKSLLAVNKMFPPPAPGQISAQTQQLAEMVLPRLLAAVKDDKMKAAATTALVALVQLVKELDSGPLAPHWEGLCGAAARVLKGEAKCQQVGNGITPRNLAYSNSGIELYCDINASGPKGGAHLFDALHMKNL